MDIFYALSEPRRRTILEIISDKGELTSSEIADKFNISAPAISQHLKVLKEADLVRVEKRAQKRVYSLNKEAFQQLIEWAEKMMKVWGERFEETEKNQESESVNIQTSNNELRKAERIDIF